MIAIGAREQSARPSNRKLRLRRVVLDDKLHFENFVPIACMTSDFLQFNVNVEFSAANRTLQNYKSLVAIKRQRQ
jgi:hypothetical protein